MFFLLSLWVSSSDSSRMLSIIFEAFVRSFLETYDDRFVSALAYRICAAPSFLPSRESWRFVLFYRWDAPTLPEDARASASS